ncbi:MAG: S4 domain-containing protein [Thermoprotei archaeon]
MANKGGSRHMKISRIPSSWPRGGKSVRFLTKPRPGPHSTEYSLPLVMLVRDVFGLASTAREAKISIISGKVSVNGKIRREEKFPVGPFDIISVESYGSYCILPRKGIGLYPVPYTGPRYLRVERKIVHAGKYQLGFHDGSNILIPKDNPFSGVKVGSTLIFEAQGDNWVPKEELPLKEGCLVVVVGGKNEGVMGTVSFVAEDQVNISTSQGQTFQTSKDHVYVVDQRIFEVISRLEAKNN